MGESTDGHNQGSALTIRAASTGERDLVARVRSRCYRPSYSHEAEMRESTAADRGDVAEGDMLLAERGGRFVATLTCLRGSMNVRGRVFDCNGIAYVGTTHDARRSGGVASKIMFAALDLARERGEVLSALMPFRASYYEHFGYGLCERRANWTVPIPILPAAAKGTELSHQFAEPSDAKMVRQLAGVRRRQFESPNLGHGDMMFPHATADGVRHWADYYAENGYLFVDLADDGSARGWIGTIPVKKGDRLGLDVQHMIFDSPAGLLRHLNFLATLRDQYGYVDFATPADVAINTLLKETQLPHRAVQHEHADCRITARNQVRVLDHLKLLDGLPLASTGKATICVKETEGHESRFVIDASDGKCAAAASEATPAFTCPDKVWAQIVLGEVTATFAARHGLATCDDEAVLPLLDAFANGPLPFCREYF